MQHMELLETKDNNLKLKMIIWHDFNFSVTPDLRSTITFWILSFKLWLLVNNLVFYMVFMLNGFNVNIITI